jgi:hypothetical protein
MLKKRISTAKMYADMVERSVKSRISGIPNNKILHQTCVKTLPNESCSKVKE